MGIFGDFENSRPKKKKQPTLIEMAEDRGLSSLVLSKIEMFLNVRREKHDIPSRTSFKEQLDLLETLSEEEQINSLRKSIMAGYRCMCYTNVAYISEYKDIKKRGNVNYTRRY